jgi:hypothetical protein
VTGTQTTARPPAGGAPALDELVAPFDASDIETTISTLQAVTERARQMRPADQDGEAR